MPNKGKLVLRVCRRQGCGKCFEARLSDVKRGWALFCSKTCKVKAPRNEPLDMDATPTLYQIQRYEKHLASLPPPKKPGRKPSCSSPDQQC